jgi:hypothetical protein
VSRAPEGQDAGRRDADGAGEPRPIVERIGLAAIAAVLGALFAFVAVVSWAGGEAFLSFMGVLGAGVTAWLAVRTLLGR